MNDKDKIEALEKKLDTVEVALKEINKKVSNAERGSCVNEDYWGGSEDSNSWLPSDRR